MRNSIYGILGMILLTFSAENSAGQWINECYPAPQNPTGFTTFTICASGSFGTSGWQLWTTAEIAPYHTLSNNHLTIRLECYRDPQYAHLQVITPWSAEIPIFGGLRPGGYRANVILTDLNQGTSATATTAFVVGPLPSINSLTSSDTTLVLRWLSHTTLLYSVQYTTQQTAYSWKYIPSFSNVPGSPSLQMEYHAPVVDAPLRVYRLISTPK